VSEEDLRREAVRRRREGDSPEVIAGALGRSSRWVRKWVARAGEETGVDWALGHSRAPLSSPQRLGEGVRALIIDARTRLVANPRAQYGALAVAWELRRMGVDPIPGAWTIDRVIRDAGLARPRRRPAAYVPKGVAYPSRPGGAEPGVYHQIDMIGPRHLDGAVEFHAVNLVDVGSHLAASRIVPAARPTLVAAAITAMWTTVGLPGVAQLDNHSNFRGAIPPNWAQFGPVVAACLDLDVTPRFIPLREPWRNGVVEHFNDVWDKSFFRTERFASLEALGTENEAFIAFHNTHHRYSAHAGRSPAEIWAGGAGELLTPGYVPPTSLPARGRIEVVRYVRSNRILNLFGKKIVLAPDHTHQYVTAVIKVRAKKVLVATTDGEIIHESDYHLSRILR